MGPADLMVWALALVVLVLALGLSAAATVLFTRFLEQHRTELATHRAQHAQRVAEARAAEQQAELEAADILERRIALPAGQRSVSLGEHLEARLDDAARALKRMQEDQDVLAQRLRAQGAQLTTVLEQRPTIVHTDTPLRAGEAVADEYSARPVTEYFDGKGER